MMIWLRRVWHLLNRSRHERELINEMNEHRALMHDPSKFGDTHRLLERSRDQWGWNWLDDAIQDLNVGVRMLMRSPSFAITATLILSFGIGLNVTLFQMVNVALLRPPAMDSPQSWVRFYRQEPHSSSSSVPYPLTQFVSSHNDVLSMVMAEAGSSIAWGADAAEQIEASFVSTNWFDGLGYGALGGRTLGSIDERSDVPNVVLGYRFWRNRLGGDPSVVGSTASIDRKPVNVVGIALQTMPGLDFDVPDVYIPISQREYFYPASEFLRAWHTDTVAMYGRLRDGISPAAAREALRSSMQAAAREHREIKDIEWLEPMLAVNNFMRPREKQEILAILSLVATLTGLVLIVAAANLGNLVISRATGRVRELGVRMALGARRTRIMRQLVIEAVPLVALGAVGSLAFGRLASTTIAALGQLPPYLDFRIEWLTIVIAIGLAGVALAVVGLLPAWKVAQQHLIDAIKDGGQQVSRALDRTLMRRIMVAGQVAGSCLLVIIAGMMVRTAQRVLTTDPGFDYGRAAVLSMPLGRYGMTGEAARTYWYSVKERVLANPEVESAAIVTAPPLGGRVFETGYDAAPRIQTLVQSIDPEYFDTMKIPLLSGRRFGPGDEQTVIISRRLALEMYGTLDVLGLAFPKAAGGRSTAQDVASLSPPEGIIIGVAADAHSIKVNATNVAELYRPLKLRDFSLVYLVARARSNADRLPPILREASTIDARVIATARALSEDFDRRTRGSRIAGAIAAGIGLVTLLLACLGIFGVVSYGVALRTKEIGIRIALGARKPALLRAIVRQVLTPVAIGVVIGLSGAVPVGRALSSAPFYLHHVDPVAFAAALAIVFCAATAAALWPAFAVLRRNPVDALRHS